MKPMTIAGIVIAVLGAVITFRGLSYGSQQNVMKVGDVQVTADEQRMIPTWVGAAAIVGGVLLVAADVRKRRGA